MPYYFLSWRGSDNGSRRFFAPDAKPDEPEDEPARRVARQLIKEMEQTLNSYHYFVLETTRIVHLGSRAYVHKPKRSWGDLLKDMIKVGPTFLKDKLRRRMHRP